MKNKGKLKWVITIFLIVLMLGSLFIFNNIAQNLLIKERKTLAKTNLNIQYENISAQLVKMNYAKQLSFNYDKEGKINVQLFNNKANQLLKENDHILYLAYFKGDILESILPEEKYGQSIGKGLNEFSYSYTLAKVVKKAVVEGPDKLSLNNKEAFLFVNPIVINNEYKGEIIAALAKDYVIRQMNLDILTKGNYDYELWKVNELGEHKIIIATSDESADFSEAVKLEFTLPAVWNISIQPQNGWLSLREKLFINLGFISLGILMCCLTGLFYLYLKQKKDLQKARYTDPDSGLYNFEGFCYFVDRVISKKGQAQFFIIYIHLLGYHDISHIMNREEMLAYYASVYKFIKDDFPEDTISAKLSEDKIAIALFKNNDDKKMIEIMNDFILQLFWKKKVKGKKVFVDPRACLVTYPTDGLNAKELIKQAEEKSLQQDKDEEYLIISDD